jgi:hypothetical protein
MQVAEDNRGEVMLPLGAFLQSNNWWSNTKFHHVYTYGCLFNDLLVLYSGTLFGEKHYF